jgi:hypothetical protein
LFLQVINSFGIELVLCDFKFYHTRFVLTKGLLFALSLLLFFTNCVEWSKEDDTKTQCNRLNTSPLHRGNAFNKNGLARVKRRMQWEAPSKPLAVDDPLLLPKREVHAEIGINWFLD